MTSRRRPPHAPAARRGRGRPPGVGLLVDRDHLLAAAERLIRAEGPDVTMDELAAAAGVTKPILYRGVGDREAVLAALADRFVTRINVAAGAAIDPAAGGRTQFRQIIGTYLDVVAADRNLYLFVVADGAGAGRVSRLLQLADRSAAPVAAMFRRAGVDEAAALTWAHAFIGALQFATFRWLRDADQSADALADQLTTLWWSGIGRALEPAMSRPPNEITKTRRPT